MSADCCVLTSGCLVKDPNETSEDVAKGSSDYDINKLSLVKAMLPWRRIDIRLFKMRDAHVSIKSAYKAIATLLQNIRLSTDDLEYHLIEARMKEIAPRHPYSFEFYTNNLSLIVSLRFAVRAQFKRQAGVRIDYLSRNVAEGGPNWVAVAYHQATNRQFSMETKNYSKDQVAKKNASLPPPPAVQPSAVQINLRRDLRGVWFEKMEHLVHDLQVVSHNLQHYGRSAEQKAKDCASVAKTFVVNLPVVNTKGATEEAQHKNRAKTVESLRQIVARAEEIVAAALFIRFTSDEIVRLILDQGGLKAKGKECFSNPAVQQWSI